MFLEGTDKYELSLTKLIYVLLAAMVAHICALALYRHFVISVETQSMKWGMLVKSYYSASLWLAVLIMVGTIFASGRATPYPRGPRRVLFSNVLLGLAGGTAAFLLSIPIFIRGDPAAKFGAQLLIQVVGLSPAAVFMFFVLLVVLPITTEVVFCAITLMTLCKYMSVTAAVIGSSLLFAYFWPVFNSLTGVVLGLIGAVLYYRTKSLTAPIVANAVLTLSGVSFVLYCALR